MDRHLLAASILVLALAIVYAATPDATAQEATRSTVCKTMNAGNPKRDTAIAAWIDSQLAEGRTEFVASQLYDGAHTLCAW